MIIQINGKVKFHITLDPSTWIFDDRKVEMEQLEAGAKSGEKEIPFEDNYEWNRDILEGGSKPPTLNSEKQFKKAQLLEGTFFMNMETFIVNAEPENGAKFVRLAGDTESYDVPLEQLHGLYFQFSNKGKRLYEDGMTDAFLVTHSVQKIVTHVTSIEVI